MGKGNYALQAFNRGLVSTIGLGRTDLDRLRFSAEVQTNWMPRTLGSMCLRPGFQFTGSTRNNAQAFHIPFVFSLTDTAILELTAFTMRVKLNEMPVTRPAVTTTVTNGGFDTDLTGWTSSDQIGATSSWATGGFMSLVGTGFNSAIRTQQITVAADSQNVQHALRFVVSFGQLTVRIGSTNGGIEYFNEVTLSEGVHSLAFTPTSANLYVRLSSATQYATLVDAVSIDVAGDLTIPTPWAENDLRNVRVTQSGDVIFCACEGYQQYKIERRGLRSWSVVKYYADDGPFRTINTGSIRLSPSALTGNTTLIATAPLFAPGHVGALFRVTSTGQTVQQALTGDGQSTNFIKVTGVGTQRAFTRMITGTYVATYTLQRSVGEPGAWVDVESGTTNINSTYNDGQDNQVIYYRYTIKSGNYTSGTVNISLTYASGGLTGVARVTKFNSELSVDVAVLKPFGATTLSDLWSEGEWSTYRGFPSSVALHEGRLWWAGKGKIWGSVSDAYASYDDTVEGDSGTISRAIGEGPVDIINWLLSMQRLIMGAGGAEWSCRSNSFEEPLTPTNFNLKSPSTQGSSKVNAVKIDTRGVFVDNSEYKLFELAFSGEALDYTSVDLTKLIPAIGKPGITRLAVQRKPDTRIHCVRKDGSVAVLIYDPIEDVKCWVEVTTAGFVEDAFTIPATGREEDLVYYAVRRVVNGQTVRFLERWAMESECRGGVVSKLADAHVVYNGAATTTITAAHLANTPVVVWANGKDLGVFTLDATGKATLPVSVTSYVAGLGYTAKFKSTKLAYASSGGTALVQRKKVTYLGVILADTHRYGLQYGPDFDRLDDMPGVEYGEDVPDDKVWESYDNDAFEFNGDYSTDSRVCLLANAPRPVTVLVCVIGMETNDRV